MSLSSIRQRLNPDRPAHAEWRADVAAKPHLNWHPDDQHAWALCMVDIAMSIGLDWQSEAPWLGDL